MKKSELPELRADYLRLAHAMQTGVAMMMNIDPSESSSKHLRVGINSAMSDQGALAKLLIDKGIITEEEYTRAMRDSMQREVDGYRAALAKHGMDVNLA